MRLLWEAFKALVVWCVHAPIRFFRWVIGTPGRFWRWIKNPANRTEGWGYFWWGAAGIVIAVPELWAAFGGNGVLWPTISGTVGNLELDHVWIALIVAGILVWGAWHAVRVTRENLRAAALEAGADQSIAPTKVGEGVALVEDVDRFTQAPETQSINAIQYLVFAVVAVAVPSWLFRHFYTEQDHRYVFGEVLYLSIAVWWMIVPGWLAYQRGYLVPYPTLFRTLKDVAGRAPIFSVIIVSGLLILLVHLILYPWPSTIPDTHRLHVYYNDCHPLNQPKQDLSPEKKIACERLDKALEKSPGSSVTVPEPPLRPPAGSP